MTTRQFKRTAYCLGVMGLWLALATPAFAVKTANVESSAYKRAFAERTVSGEAVAMETCPATAAFAYL
jgi:hypothetical protein